MADSEEGEELVDHISLLVLTGASGVHKRVGAIVQDVRHLFKRLPPVLFTPLASPDQFSIGSLAFVHGFGIRYTGNTAALEFHLVAGKRSGLVTEDVFDLAEFLDERRCPAECGCVRFGIVHVQVRVDELGLLELDNLHRDDERDWDQVVVQNDERQDICSYDVLSANF